MVQLTLPLLDNTDNESGNATDPNCDPSQSIYNKKYCIKDFLFCSDDNPCPSKIPCVDRVCQCLPNTKQYITLTPLPVRMYTIGCNFNTKRDTATSCRDYEYGVSGTCLLNYCSSEVPCYAGNCDNKNNVCVNITSARQTLPTSNNAPITLGDDPFGTNKEGISPILFVLMICGVIVALALVGCIIRTTMQWTKSSVAWASGSKNKNSDSMTDEKDNEGNPSAGAAAKGPREMLQDEEGDGNAPAIVRVPSKFTGRHYLPSPPVMFSNEISPFSSPLPSPRFSPYSQPNQSQVSSNHSLMNPFRQPANPPSEDASTARSIELNDRSRPSTSSNGSTHDAAHIPGNESSIQGPEILNGGTDLRIARSQTLSRDFTTTPTALMPPANRRIGGGPTTLQKSSSMLQLGSRPAPPPPSPLLHKSRSNLSSAPRFPVSAPLPSIPGDSQQHQPPQHQLSRSSTVITSAGLQGPSPSLDSIIGFSTNSNSTGGGGDQEQKHHNTSADLTSVVLDSSSSLSPSLHSITSVGGGPSMPMLHSAERHPSLTVPARHSMLKHSASVPQMMYASSSPVPVLGGPTSRNLPAGFASSPIANSEERFRS
ncbi:hypothetical protein EMPS_03160 [Entomortierella parvispora]|uniref:Uncharacterized protein n=1 Tax=Entomortierella parvispora TaxID=205924 RepID=A0A9P3LUM0_9FUNG|nr:hypothetical protein EMPS_03160 [Entomortierella parvispora]